MRPYNYPSPQQRGSRVPAKQMALTTTSCQKRNSKSLFSRIEFLEWAEYGGNLYGTLKSEIAAAREAGKDAILEIEVEGSLEIRKRQQDLAPARNILIFIVPPSFATLEKRLRRRDTESESRTETAIGYSENPKFSDDSALRLLGEQLTEDAIRTGSSTDSDDH